MKHFRFKRFFRSLYNLARTFMLAYMLGISNIVNEEVRYIEDSATKIEYHQEATDDEPFDEPEEPNQ